MNQPVERVWDVVGDFNGHKHWHPEILKSEIERGFPSNKVGCIRTFLLKDGAQLREQLLALSDVEQSYTYCLYETPIPLLNYVSHVRLFPVTDTDYTFWEWEAQFNTIAGREEEMKQFVGNDIFECGFKAVAEYLERTES